MGTSDDLTPMNPKNSTGSKRAHRGLKFESLNGGPEVYVLPPHLLQKLGINLANIVIPGAATSNNTVGNGNIHLYCFFLLFVLLLYEFDFL